MKKIAYIMHIPYEWAKQRPQFIAEELSSYFELSIGTIESFKKANLRKEVIPFRHVRSKVIPLSHKSAILRKVNNYLVGRQLKELIDSHEVIWLTHPSLWRPIQPYLSKKHILVYDCMDNAIEFPREKDNLTLQAETKENEFELFSRANVSFFSSYTLMKTLSIRYNLKGKNWHILNNGISDSMVERYAFEKTSRTIAKKGIETKLVYLGTISSWFDFELILNSLVKYPALEVHLYGPKEVDIPPVDRLFFHGPVPHNQVFTILQNADCLIMPFKITPLIESVNPVKLYEYIASGKPALAPYYYESSQFEDFVHLYKTTEEWDLLLHKLITKGLHAKKDKETTISFCKKNTWKKRATSAKDILLENS